MRVFKLVSKEAKASCIKYIMSIMGEDKPQEVVIRDLQDSKSQEQTDFMHVLLRIMANDIGLTEAAMKDTMVVNEWGTQIVMLNGKEIEIRRSTKKLNMKETGQLIESIYREAAEMGIVLPPPMRNYNE